MSLPTVMQSRKGMAPKHARVLLGAPAKCGKSTLLGTWAPSTTLIVDTQNGTQLLDGDHYVEHVHNWPQFVGVVDDIVKGGHHYHTIGLDLVGDLWRFCDLHYGKRDDGIQIPASAVEDYNRSAKKAQTAFIGQIGRLLTCPVGIWFLTHLFEKKDKKGELSVYVPDLDSRVADYIVSSAGFVWLAETKLNGDRIIHTQRTQHFAAGSRVTMPSPLPMNVRVIATELDRALNPEKYAKPTQAAPVAEVAQREMPAEAEPPRQHVEDFKRTGGSDVTGDPDAVLFDNPAEGVGTDGELLPWADEPPADVDLPTLDGDMHLDSTGANV